LKSLFVAGIAMMALAIILSLVATSDRVERFERERDTSGLLDLNDEKNFISDKTTMDLHISLTNSKPFHVRITRDGMSTEISTESLELAYIPDSIEVEGQAIYTCEIVAISGKPYLLLSIPALILALAGFAVMFTTGATLFRKKKE